jgi:protein-tyrosine phosphatase
MSADAADGQPRGVRMSSRSERELDWEGCFNVRDLGGIPTAEGRQTRWGAVIRADELDGLTRKGWASLLEHGVRTVVDLRNDDERGADAAPRPSILATTHIPLDCNEDRQFWNVWDSGPQFGTPLYYRPHLDRFPERSVAVLSAIARAEPRGVAFHCGGGRDRAGQIAMLLLALAGVPADQIAADYALSADRLRARHTAHGEEDQGPLLETCLVDQGTTAEEIIIDIVSSLDIEACLGAGGLTDHDLVALRSRLVSPQ